MGARMEGVLIFCGIGVLVVANFGANILSQRALPTPRKVLADMNSES